MIDWYELYLIGLLMSHPRVSGYGLHIWPEADAQGGPSVHLSLHDEEPLFDFRADTLAEAAADALRALGVETVPERPSAEWVGGAAVGMVETYVNAIEAQDKGTWTAGAPIEAIFGYLRDLAAREPETVLTLIFGGRDG